MVDKRTIADSKRDFHRSFPHVIPPLYRRAIDELLVELHLLSHQKSFQQNIFFSLGLLEAFNTFPLGYKPKEHINKLFEALCKSNDFDPVKINNEAIRLTRKLKDKSDADIDKIFATDDEIILKEGIYYTRLMSLGLFGLIKSLKKEAISTADIIKESTKISAAIGMPEQRVAKDLNIYNSNIEKLTQAVELLNEASMKEKKKNEVK